MKTFLILLLIFTASCGKAPEEDKEPVLPVVVDASLAPYLDKFAQVVGVNTGGISAKFEALEAPTVGQCSINGPNKIIRVDPTYWNNANADDREQLVFHELGHCAMGLGHINTLDAQNCPTSIMYKSTFGYSTCYINSQQYYYNELASHK